MNFPYLLAFVEFDFAAYDLFVPLNGMPYFAIAHTKARMAHEVTARRGQFVHLRTPAVFFLEAETNNTVVKVSTRKIVVSKEMACRIERELEAHLDRASQFLVGAESARQRQMLVLEMMRAAIP